RTSSDLRLNPHLHAVFLDGAFHEQDGEVVFEGLSHVKTSEVGGGARACGQAHREAPSPARPAARSSRTAPTQSARAILRASWPPRPSRARRHPAGPQ